MRRPRAWAVAGGCAAMALALALFDPRLFTGGDNAHYYALAEALATGRGYVDLVAPGHPLHAVYPPGFPLWLVPFHWLTDGSYVAMKLASLAAAAAALAFTWALARRDRAVPPWAAAAAVALVGLYPVFLDYAHWLLSEATFLAVSLAALVAFERATSADAGDRPGGWWLAGCGIAVLAFAVRTAGVALLAAPVAWALLARRWRRGGVAAAAGALAAGPWLFWTARHAPATGGYLEQLLASDPYDPTSPALGIGGLLARAGANLIEYATVQLPLLVWPSAPAPTAVRALALTALVALLVLGVARALRARGLRVWETYLLLALGLLLLWPWTGDRFLLTVAPLLWLWILVGLDAAARLVAGGPRPAMAVAGAVALVLLVGALRRVPAQWEVTRAHIDGDELAGYDPFWSDYFEAAGWIGAEAPHAIVLARKPTLAWYWSRRPSVVYPFRADPDATWRFVRERGITHVLLDPLGSTRAYLVPALQDHLDEVEAVHAAPARNVYVLRVRPNE